MYYTCIKSSIANNEVDGRAVCIDDNGVADEMSCLLHVYMNESPLSTNSLCFLYVLGYDFFTRQSIPSWGYLLRPTILVSSSLLESCRISKRSGSIVLLYRYQ